MKKYILYLLLFISLTTLGQAGTFKYYRVQNAGGATLIAPVNLPNTIFVYASGSVTLANDFSINISSLPPVGTRFKVYVQVNSVTPNGHDIIIFGQTLTSSSYLYYTCYEFSVVNDHTGTAVLYYNQAPADFTNTQFLNGQAIIDGTLPYSALDGAVPIANIDTTGRGRIWYGNSLNATSTLYAAGNGKILIGDGSDINSKSITGDITLTSAGVVNIDSGTIVDTMIKTGAAIQRQKIAAGTASQVLVNNASGYMSSEATLNPLRGGTGANTSASTGFATVSAGSWTVGAISEILTLQVSFESGYAGDFKIKLPYAGTVTGIYAYAIKAIAGTDDGTIVAKNNGGTTMTNGTITFTASDPRGTAYTVSPSANNTFSAGDLLTFTTAKTTAGGVVQLSITVTRSN